MGEFTKNNDELMHYGVLGMRWGVRKDKDTLLARKSSRTTRGLQRRLNKDEKRAAKGKRRKYDTGKLQAALDRSKKFDAEVQKRVSSMSRGKTAIEVITMGSRGALRYNQLRTKGYNRAVSAIGAVVVSGVMDSEVGNIARGIATNYKHKARKKKS